MGLLAEAARLQALRSYQVLDTPSEPQLDELARTAAEACAVPVALVSLVDSERQFFKARVGIDVVETPRQGSFCSHAIEQDDLFEVPDARADRRFRSHPLVTGDPHIRFYAAAPLITAENAAIGTLCVIDSQPGKLASGAGRMLKLIGKQVMRTLEQRKADLVQERVRRALDFDVRSQLEGIARRLGTLQGPAKELAEVLMAADSAAQTVDDAVETLTALRGLPLQRRKADLAVACGELVEAFQEPGRPRTLLSVAGDCQGFWDLDRLTHALAALIERAGQGPVRVSVRGLQKAVVVTIRAPAIALADTDLRTELALQIIRAHGGEVEATNERSGIRIAVCLPRAAC